MVTVCLGTGHLVPWDYAHPAFLSFFIVDLDEFSAYQGQEENSGGDSEAAGGGGWRAWWVRLHLGGPVCPERSRVQDRRPRAPRREQVEDMVPGGGYVLGRP